MIGIVYCVTNLINGKQYIGQTTESLKTRWQRHVNYARTNATNMLLHKAIRSYGPEHFRITEIAYVNSMSELNELEKIYIAKFQSAAPNGYNLTSGGRENHFTEEARKRISAGVLRSMTKEVREKLSNAATGRKFTAEHKNKIRLAHLQKSQSKTRCVNGHLLDEQNTYLNGKGKRTCRVCNNASWRKSAIKHGRIKP